MKKSIILPNNVTLVINKDYMEGFFNKNKTLFVPVERVSLININVLRSYVYRGVKMMLIEYKLRLDAKKKSHGLQIYGYVSSHLSDKMENRLKFLKYLKEKNFLRKPYLVPKLMGFFPKLNLLLREKVHGLTALDHIKKRHKLDQAFKESAKWLSKFHNVPANKGFSSALFRDQEQFGFYQKNIQNVLPDHKGKVRQMLDMIYEQEKDFYKNRQNELALIHGDFQPQNVFYDFKKRTVTVIDFDWGAIADPASDVGNFIIQFKYKARSILDSKHIKRQARLFIEEYCKRFNKIPTDFFQRINLYQARFAIQRAAFIAEFHVPGLKGTKRDKEVKDAKWLLNLAWRSVKSKKLYI